MPSASNQQPLSGTSSTRAGHRWLLPHIKTPTLCYTGVSPLALCYTGVHWHCATLELVHCHGQKVSRHRHCATLCYAAVHCHGQRVLPLQLQTYFLSIHFLQIFEHGVLYYPLWSGSLHCSGTSINDNSIFIVKRKNQ